MYLRRCSSKEACVVPDNAEASESVDTNIAQIKIFEKMLHSEVFAMGLIIAECHCGRHTEQEVLCEYPVVGISSVDRVGLILQALRHVCSVRLCR